jgi:ComF family protein
MLMFVMEKLVALVAPHTCLICGDEGAVICDWCLPDFALPVPSRCYRCQKYNPDCKVCSRCRRQSRLAHVWVCSEYDERAKALIHAYKFDRKQAAAQPLATLLAQVLPSLPGDTVVTHVPTASSRVRQRGYDHAQLVARALAGQLGLPYRPLLRRITQTRQVGAKRSVRLRQMERAFTAIEGTLPPKALVLIVDDLVTTGATLEAAATELRRAGARTVDAAVFAQKR